MTVQCDHQNGLVHGSHSLVCWALLGIIIQSQWRPRSWGPMPLKADLATPTVLAMRVLLGLTWEDPVAGRGAVNMVGKMQDWSTSLEPPC